MWDAMGYVGGAEGGRKDGVGGGERGIIKTNTSRTRTNSGQCREEARERN